MIPARTGHVGHTYVWSTWLAWRQKQPRAPLVACNPENTNIEFTICRKLGGPIMDGDAQGVFWVQRCQAKGASGASRLKYGLLATRNLSYTL